MSILLTVIILGIIVIIHEGGHFIAAKKCGVLVEEFAIGMGPKIFSRKKGETLYSIRLFPIGGFCRMADEDTAPTSSRGFNAASIYRRMIIVLAGVLMNFVLAFLISMGVEAFSAYTQLDIIKVEKGSPAETVGIMPGDRIVKINNSSVHIYEDLMFELSTIDSNIKNIEVTVKRNDKYIDFYLEPIKSSERLILGISLDIKSPMIGDSVEGYKRANLIDVAYSGFWKMIYMLKVTVYSIVQLFTMQASLDDFGGPIGLTTFVGEVYEESIKEGIFDVIIKIASITSLISVNIGFMNLLPIPALDGGRFVFLVVEWLRGKPIPPEKEGFVHVVGLVVLMIFGVFIAFNDIIKLL